MSKKELPDQSNLFLLLGAVVLISVIVLLIMYAGGRKDRTQLAKDNQQSQQANNQGGNMDQSKQATLYISSTAFNEGQAIPAKYTCRGENISPPLQITGTPEGTKSLALIMHDPDAVSGDFTHWLMWNILPASQSIDENDVPAGAVQGNNGANKLGYMGPCPPAGTGTHHYIFELYALSEAPNLEQGSDRGKLEAVLQGHTLAQTKLTGLFSAE